MANPFGPVQADLSGLSRIGDTIQESRKRSAIAKLMGGAGEDSGAAVRALMGAGYLDEAGQAAQAHKAIQPPASLTPRPTTDMMNADFFARLPEGDPRKAYAPTKNQPKPMTASDKRALYTAEDEMPALQGTIETLDRALEINDQTFYGPASSTRAFIGTQIPGGDRLFDPKQAEATSEWERLMQPAALDQMAATLKGATTDFELRKYISLLADPDTKPSVRAGIIQRMKTLAERQYKVKEGRINELRGSAGPVGAAGAEDELQEGEIVYDPQGNPHLVQGGQLVPQ